MKLRPEEIASVLKSQIEDYQAEVEVDEVGTVLEVGDGIARIYGLRNCMAMEMLELPHGVTGLALNLEEDNVGAVLLGEDTLIKEGDLVKRTGRVLQVPVGEALVGRVVDPLGRPLDDKGPIETERLPPGRVQGAGRRRAPAGQGAAADRHQGHRLDDPHRPRPARAHHRRPPDRQDVDHRRHDHQPEGPGRDLHLRGHRPEGLDGHAGRAEARGVRRHGVHHRRRGHGLGLGAAQVPRALRRRRHGRVLPLQRPPRRLLLRRPLQAGRRLPPDVAAAAPPAGPRSVPRRRLLPALAPARARRQAQRRARRRLAHRHPGHRDAGRRRVGLHPDQRDLHHRRPDLPAERPVLQRRAAGGQHRHLGQPRGRQRPDQGDEAGRRPSAHRPRPVPRAAGLRPVRLRPRRGHQADAGPRRAHDRGPQPGPLRPHAGRGAGRRHLRRHPGLHRRHRRGARRARSARACASYLRSQNAERARGDPRREGAVARERGAAPRRHRRVPQLVRAASRAASPSAGASRRRRPDVATLRDIRRRIASVQNTRKITKAMEMVAAAKLRRNQAAHRGAAAVRRRHDRDDDRPRHVLRGDAAVRAAAGAPRGAHASPSSP